MQFAIALATAADSWRVVQRAEDLGFAAAWFYDTQMLSADCFVAMGAAAVKTKRIRLGTGVLVPSNRIAPVTANAFASLNQLAPGRIDFGIGTGFTARRAMGLGAVRLADMEEYIRVVRALLAEETVEAQIEGKRRKMRFLNPEAGLINTTDPVALHVSAYGPRARALVARLGAGWVNFVSDETMASDTIEAMRKSWTDSGREITDLRSTAFVLGCVLAADEPTDSPRAMAQSGPRAAVLLHRAADAAIAGLPNTSAIPDAVADTVARYVQWAKAHAPADAPWLTNHRGHLMFVREEERPFVTRALIEHTTFTGTADDLAGRIESLRDAGYQQVAIQLTPGQESAVEDWGALARRFG